MYIPWNCQFPSENWSFKWNHWHYRMLVSSMKITCCLHNIHMQRSSKCHTSKGMTVLRQRFMHVTLLDYMQILLLDYLNIVTCLQLFSDLMRSCCWANSCSNEHGSFVILRNVVKTVMSSCASIVLPPLVLRRLQRLFCPVGTAVAQWCRKMSDPRICLSKFHSDWQKINISAAYFIIASDKISPKE